MKHIAIVGSGPAGCYLAEQLLRASDDLNVSVIERLPVPFGLVRYGVAPDHQGTKAIARLLGRVLGRDRVQFFGNVNVGADVTLEELASTYDAVALATGAPQDRALGIAGETLPGVTGSGAFVRWYNNHPNHRTPALRGVRSAVVIGNGNVAIDIVRMLAKSAAEFVGSDLASAVSGPISEQPIELIHVVGRRGPAAAKFTQAELAELGELERARPRIVDPNALAQARNTGAAGPILDLFEHFAADTRALSLEIRFHFNMRPIAFEGATGLDGVRFERDDGTATTLPAQLAVTCIGYHSIPCCSATPEGGIFANENARIKDGLYVTGWAGRGPSGTIPTNRTEAKEVARVMAGEVIEHGRGGADALSELLTQRAVRIVSHADWQQIDAAEKARAEQDRCRTKFDSIEAMLAAIDA